MHSVRKGKYDKNALVMGFSSFKMIPSKYFISDINGYMDGEGNDSELSTFELLLGAEQLHCK